MRTLARVAAVGALVFALTAVIVGTVVGITQGDQIEPGTIVVVGDPTTPAIQDVLEELQDRAAHGDELDVARDLNLTGLVPARALEEAAR